MSEVKLLLLNAICPLSAKEIVADIVSHNVDRLVRACAKAGFSHEDYVELRGDRAMPKYQWDRTLADE